MLTNEQNLFILISYELSCDVKDVFSKIAVDRGCIENRKNELKIFDHHTYNRNVHTNKLFSNSLWVVMELRKFYFQSI